MNTTTDIPQQSMNKSDSDRCNVNAGVYIPQTYTDPTGPLSYDPNAQLERHLQVHDNRINDFSADPTVARSGKGPDVHIGLDAEWVFDEKTGQNNILSAQFYMVGECGDYPRVFYPRTANKADRPSFAKSVSTLIREALNVGILLEWPARIIICGFFLRVDLAVFSDLVKFKNQIDNVGGRAATIGDDAVLDVELGPEDLSEITKRRSSVVSDEGIPRIMAIRFLDMGRHAPEGTQLSALGDLLGLPKLPLPEGHVIERMDLLLKHDKPAFEAYGLRDAEIPVKYMLKLQDFARSETGIKALPTTASGLGVKIFIGTLEASGAEFNDVFGLKASSETIWSKGGVRGKAGVRTFTELVPSDIRAIHEPFIANCYHGGRNECYRFGPTTEDVWNDFDLVGAYPSGLVDIRHIDYSAVRTTKNLTDFKGHVMGFALVNFAHPDSVRFPVLPVRHEKLGLVFPLSGMSYCTAAEIDVALTLGCEIEIIHGVVYPWREGDSRIFEPFTRRIRELRSRHPKGSLNEQYAKLLGNSCYGKTAQGLRAKRVFDSRAMKSEQLPPSQITNAAMAAHVTGFIRAILAEILNRIPHDHQVVSVTTDGFLTTASETDLDLTGAMARRYDALCERVAPGKGMLDRKHRVRQLLPFKTRGQLTTKPYDDEPVVLAKAGVSPPVPRCEHNAYMVDLFLHRQPGDRIQTRSFTSMREQWVKGEDVMLRTSEIAMNMEYDMKRCPVNPIMRAVGAMDHLAFDTKPWPDAGQGERARAYLDGWRRHNCLKTLSDYQAWQEHYAFAGARKKQQRGSDRATGINATAEGSIGLLRRLFLRAYTQGAWGLARSMTYPALAAWLTGNGYPTTLEEVKNAKRATLVEGVVPLTLQVKSLLDILASQFPNLDLTRFLVSDGRLLGGPP